MHILRHMGRMHKDQTLKLEEEDFVKMSMSLTATVMPKEESDDSALNMNT